MPNLDAEILSFYSYLSGLIVDLAYPDYPISTEFQNSFALATALDVPSAKLEANQTEKFFDPAANALEQVEKGKYTYVVYTLNIQEIMYSNLLIEVLLVNISAGVQPELCSIYLHVKNDYLEENTNFIIIIF